MSVIKSKRNLSNIQYIMDFRNLYDYTTRQLYKIPKRKQRWLGEPIINRMNKIESLLMEMSNEYFVYGINTKNKQERAKTIIKQFMKLQKPLIALWNIERYEQDEMIRWCELINDLIRNVAASHCLPYNDEIRYMFILDYSSIKRTEFMRNMSELHRLIYTHCISMPRNFRDTKGLRLMELADNALFYLSRANIHIPKTKSQYENRRKDISTALECINEMQIPLFSVFNGLHYKNETMEQFAKMISYELKLLKGLLKSDEVRFSDIQ